MNAKYYAHAFRAVLKGKTAEEKKVLLDNFLKVLKARGHEKLLPKILLTLEKEDEEGRNATTVTFSKIEDKEKFKKEIETALQTLVHKEGGETVVKEDNNLIGGYRIETEDQLIDQSYKSALVDLYRKLIA